MAEKRAIILGIVAGRAAVPFSRGQAKPSNDCSRSKNGRQDNWFRLSENKKFRLRFKV